MLLTLAIEATVLVAEEDCGSLALQAVGDADVAGNGCARAVVEFKLFDRETFGALRSLDDSDIEFLRARRQIDENLPERFANLGTALFPGVELFGSRKFDLGNAGHNLAGGAVGNAARQRHAAQSTDPRPPDPHGSAPFR